MINPNQKVVRDMFLETGVWQEEHSVLNSGLHTDVKLDMECLAEPRNWGIWDNVVNEVCIIGQANDIQGYMPVPDGALKIAKIGPILPRIFDVVKIGKREFEFPELTIERIKNFGRIAVFEDVVTTGGTPATLARKVKNINPDIEIDLIALWRRGELLKEHTKVFKKTHFLVEEMIPSWNPEDCLNPDCQTA